MSARHVSPGFDLVNAVLTVNLTFSELDLVFPLPYNLNSPYISHIFLISYKSYLPYSVPDSIYVRQPDSIYVR